MLFVQLNQQHKQIVGQFLLNLVALPEPLADCLPENRVQCCGFIRLPALRAMIRHWLPPSAPPGDLRTVQRTIARSLEANPVSRAHRRSQPCKPGTPNPPFAPSSSKPSCSRRWAEFGHGVALGGESEEPASAIHRQNFPPMPSMRCNDWANEKFRPRAAKRQPWHAGEQIVQVIGTPNHQTWNFVPGRARC